MLLRLAEVCRAARAARPRPPPSRLRALVDGCLAAGRDDDAFPVAPPRALWELREALAPADMLISDVGLHKLWIARMFGAHEPNTVLIANGLAGDGLRAAERDRRQARAPRAPRRRGLRRRRRAHELQELETATRLGTAVRHGVWEDGGFGSIAWKQRQRFDGEHFGTDFCNPDFVGLAESFGMPAWRCDSAGDFGPRLRHALSLDVPSLIVLPIDYSVDVAISDELGEETVIRT